MPHKGINFYIVNKHCVDMLLIIIVSTWQCET